MKKLIVLTIAILVSFSSISYALSSYEEALINNDIAKFEQQRKVLNVKVNYQELLKLYLTNRESKVTLETLQFLVEKNGANLGAILTKKDFDDYQIASIAYKIDTVEVFNYILAKGNIIKNNPVLSAYFNSVIFNSNTTLAINPSILRQQYLSAITQGANEEALVSSLLKEYQDYSVFDHYNHYIQFFTLITDHAKVGQEFIKKWGNYPDVLGKFALQLLYNQGYKTLELLLAFEPSLLTRDYAVSYSQSKQDSLLGVAKYLEDIKSINIIEKAMSLPLSSGGTHQWNRL